MPENKPQTIEDAIARLGERHESVFVWALKTAQERLQTDPTEANIRAAQAAKKALDDLLASSLPPADEVIKNRIALASWLRERGYKIGKQKVYNDADKGLLRLAADGSCTASEAERYARSVGLKRYDQVDGAAVDREQRRKIELDNHHTRLKIQRLEVEIAEKQGELIPRIELDQQLAGVLAVIKHRMIHMFQSRSAELLAVGQKQGPQAMADIGIELVTDEFDYIGRQDELEVVAIAASV